MLLSSKDTIMKFTASTSVEGLALLNVYKKIKEAIRANDFDIINPIFDGYHGLMGFMETLPESTTGTKILYSTFGDDVLNTDTTIIAERDGAGNMRLYGLIDYGDNGTHRITYSLSGERESFPMPDDCFGTPISELFKNQHHWTLYEPCETVEYMSDNTIDESKSILPWENLTMFNDRTGRFGQHHDIIRIVKSMEYDPASELAPDRFRWVLINSFGLSSGDVSKIYDFITLDKVSYSVLRDRYIKVKRYLTDPTNNSEILNTLR